MSAENRPLESSTPAGLGGLPRGRLPLAAFVFSLVTFQGLTINLMPLVVNVLAETFHVELKKDLGWLQTTFLTGGIFSLFVSGYITDYVRAARSGTFAVMTLAAGLLFLGCATTYRHTVIAFGLMGVGNSWILAAYSSVISEFFPDVRPRMFMWAAAAFAFCAAAGSYGVGFLLVRLANWQVIFVIMGAAFLIEWVLLFALAPKQLAVLGRRHRVSDLQASTRADSGSPWQSVVAYLYAGLFNRRALWVLGLLVVLDNLASGNSVTWTALLFREEYGIDEQQASMMLSAVALGYFFGRLFIGTFISGRFSDLAVLGVCYTGAIGTYGLLLVAPNYNIGVALFFLSGALMSAQAPTMYSIISAKFGPRAPIAIPLVDAIGILGSFMGPTIVGALADEAGGLRSVLWLIPASGAVFVSIVAAWWMLDRRA